MFNFSKMQHSDEERKKQDEEEKKLWEVFQEPEIPFEDLGLDELAQIDTNTDDALDEDEIDPDDIPEFEDDEA
jgi:hypothetical protein